MSSLKISVVTPTFNLIDAGRKETFLRAIQSVQAQTFPDIEHIVADGGSSDGTVELLQQEQSAGRINHFISKNDSGIYQALNRGADVASGDYLLILPSDDYYHDCNGALNIAELAEAKDRPDLIVSPVRVTDDVPELWAASLMFRTIYTQMPYGHLGMAVKLDTFRKLGGFDESYKICGDWDLLFRLLMNDASRALLSPAFGTYDPGGLSSDFVALTNEIPSLLENNLRDVLKIDKDVWDTSILPRKPTPNWILFRAVRSRTIPRHMRLLAAMQIIDQSSPQSLQRVVSKRPWR